MKQIICYLDETDSMVYQDEKKEWSLGLFDNSKTPQEAVIEVDADFLMTMDAYGYDLKDAINFLRIRKNT